MSEVDQAKLIFSTLGFPGKMISANKTAPAGHVAVFNANVYADNQKIWYGDINLTKEAEKVKKLARALGAKLYVLREMDGRFENEGQPKLERAVMITDGKTIAIGPEHTSYYRISEGKIVR